jgi:hypothetical protein
MICVGSKLALRPLRSAEISTKAITSVRFIDQACRCLPNRGHLGPRKRADHMSQWISGSDDRGRPSAVLFIKLRCHLSLTCVSAIEVSRTSRALVNSSNRL